MLPAYRRAFLIQKSAGGGLSYKVKKGTLLGTLKDIYGNEIFRCTAPFDGVVLYYTLSLGVKCKDPLIAFGEI